MTSRGSENRYDSRHPPAAHQRSAVAAQPAGRHQLVPARLQGAVLTSGPAVAAALWATRRTAGPEALGGQTQGAHRVPGALWARVHHRRRGCGRFFVFVVVVQVGCRGQQPDRAGARNHSEPDSQEGSRGHARGDDGTLGTGPGDARATVYPAPDNGCSSKISTAHASPHNSRANTLAVLPRLLPLNHQLAATPSLTRESATSPVGFAPRAITARPGWQVTARRLNA